MISEYDFIVIGGGIAGVSVAAHLSEKNSVRLLEMEDQPGYHSTGRSAALFIASYGNSIVRNLTRASRNSFFAPSANFTSANLVNPRQILITAAHGKNDLLAAFKDTLEPEDDAAYKSPEEAAELFPILKAGAISGAILINGPADIDVYELQQSYLRILKRHGGVVSLRSRVMDLQRDRGGWTIITSEHETIRAGAIINAAGAWAGDLGEVAGAIDIGLHALKRSACLVEPPAGVDITSWPMIADVDEEFYAKPDAGMLLLSPSDETLTPPCDAQPDEMDIAVAVDRVEQVTTLTVRRVTHKWAGLRSFVADSSPVIGYDPIQPGFFWLAALGGFGVQTAPAIGQLAAALAQGEQPANELLDFGIDLAAIAPGREYQLQPETPMIGIARLSKQ